MKTLILLRVLSWKFWPIFKNIVLCVKDTTAHSDGDREILKHHSVMQKSLAHTLVKNQSWIFLVVRQNTGDLN